MRLTFLGTAAGLPAKNRNVSALILALDESRKWCLIDCGEGTQQQLLGCGYTLSNLQAIFITHVHGDHMFGLPGLITTAAMQGRTKSLTICAPEFVERFVRTALECADSSELPFTLEFIRSDRPDFLYQTDDFVVTSHELSHRVPSYAYAFAEKPNPPPLSPARLVALNIPQGPLWGTLQQGRSITLENGETITPEMVRETPPKPRFVVIGGDNDQPSLLHHLLTRADLLVHEATFTTDVLKKSGGKYMHSSAELVGRAAEQAELGHLILTHFSNRYSSTCSKNAKKGTATLADLHDEAKAVYSGNLVMARDMGCWQLKKDRSLIAYSSTACKDGS